MLVLVLSLLSSWLSFDLVCQSVLYLYKILGPQEVYGFSYACV